MVIRALAPVTALLFGVAILLAGQGLQGVLIPVRAALEEFSTVSIGLMGGAYFLGFTFGCLRGGDLIRRVGHVRVFAAMTAVASAAPLLHGLWAVAWMWALLRVISGYCFAVLYVVIESWLNEHATNETRGTVFSAYVLITLTVLAVGQQMLLLYDPQRMALFAIASALVSLAAVPVVLSNSPKPQQPDTIKLDIGHLHRLSPAGVIGCFAAGLVAGAFWSLAPLFTAAHSSDVGLAASFMTASVLGGAIGQWPLGLWSDRVDRRLVLAVIALVASATGATMWLMAPQLSIAGIIVLAALWGAVSFPMYSISTAHANDYAEPDEYVLVSSGLLLMYGIGAIIGPFIASGMMTWLAPGGLYLFTALVNIVFGVYLMYRTVRRTPPSERAQFSDALASAQTASSVYEEELYEEEQ
jgi:MFS family permease